jgi:two-component system, NarL family, invasion response regulator UvrY
VKNFLLIDDHEIVRTGLKNVLLNLFQPCEVYESWDEETALELLKTHSFTLVIMDVQMPGSNAIELMQFMKINYPGIRVLVFSMSNEKIYSKIFFKAGAMGFVSKASGVPELKKAIELALKNRRYVSDILANLLADKIESKETNTPFEKLSAREFDIATALINGSSVGEIAASLNISASTVGTYKARLFEKLQIKNIVDLVEMGRIYKAN